jgi:DNA-binding Lrp family transcriptional regulator
MLDPQRSPTDHAGQEAFRLALLNPWQHHFPLEREPFARIAAELGCGTEAVLDGYRRLVADGSLSRIGAVFAAGAGGASVLAAMAVPTERLQAVADRVSAHPGVNHNYEREHRHNLWFVMTGADAAEVESSIVELEAATGCATLRLPMLRPYRIDLGFDLRSGERAGACPSRGRAHRSARRGAAVAAADLPLAALAEQGLPIVAQPYDDWARQLGRSAGEILATLSTWCAAGTLRRFGTVVRHHELGWGCNAMTVFDVPDDQVDACGAALAAAPGVTLAYRRARAEGWPYNLYCMVHGRDRRGVLQHLADGIALAGLADRPRNVLFSSRRFKQTGASRFRAALPQPMPLPSPRPLPKQESDHACA